jgi:hypothetical protein
LSGLASEELGAQLGLLFGVKPVQEGLSGLFLGIWQRFDVIHYLRIAQSGYTQTDLSAFFPLFPFFARYVAFFCGRNYLLSLTIVSNVSLLFALIVLYKITTALFTDTIAKQSIITTLFFPTAFFYFAPYPQSLSLFLVLWAYYLAYKKLWKPAFLVGVLAGLTHSTVVPLVLALLVEAYRQWPEQHFKGKLAMVTASSGSLFGVVGFLSWRYLHGFPPYGQIVEQYWGRSLQWPWQTLIQLSTKLFSPNWLLLSWHNIFILLLVVLVAVKSIKNMRRSLAVYTLTSLFFLLSTSIPADPLASFGRYSLLIFPMFIEIARTANTPRKRLIYTAFGFSMQLFLAGQYFMWGWVG